MPRSAKSRTRAHLILRTLGALLGALFLAVVALGATVAAWRMFERERDATSAADASARELALVESQEAVMQGDISALSSARGVEAAVRERYGVARPGEGVIQIVEDHTSQATSTATSTPGGWFGRIFHALFSW